MITTIALMIITAVCVPHASWCCPQGRGGEDWGIELAQALEASLRGAPAQGEQQRESMSAVTAVLSAPTAATTAPCAEQQCWTECVMAAASE